MRINFSQKLNVGLVITLLSIGLVHFDAESIGKGNAGLLLPECSVGNCSGDASS